MTRVVISQPMFFPWVGMFEQLRLADVYVHYDDVQFSKGSFTNRVQIKTIQGPKWLTLPVGVHLGEAINQVRLAQVRLAHAPLARSTRQSPASANWRARHLAFLAQAFAGAPHLEEALGLVRSVYESPHDQLCELVIASMEAVLGYFELAPAVRFLRSSQMNVPGSGWARVLEIVKRTEGDVYVTGHGARNYLDHEAFERAGVRVEYMDYERRPYPQLHGAFTPHVSILDLVANVGRAGRSVIASGTKPWREFLSAS